MPATGTPFIQNFAEQASSSLLSAILGPGIRASSYAANKQLPNVLPPPGSVFNAWIGGYLAGDAGKEAVRNYCELLGINMGIFGKLIGSEAVDLGGKVWPAVLYSSLQKPSPAEWVTSWLRGHTKTSVAVEHESKLGTDKPMYKAIQNLYRLWPSTAELMQLLNRDILTVEEYREYMQHTGGYTEPVIDYYQELTKLVPGPSDLVRFAVREAFTPALAGPLGYYDEYPGEVAKYLKWQGLGWPLGFQVPTKGGDVDATWGHMYWASHWQTLTPSQIYRFYQLFRPNRLVRYQNRGFKVKEFSLNTVRDMLKVNDYPEPLREWLAAASYLPMRLFDIRNGYLQEIRGADTTAWAREQLLDRGNHPDDVEDTLTLWRIQASGTGPAEEMKRRKQQRDSCRKKLEIRTLSMLKNGIISAEAAEGALANVGWEKATAANCIREAELAKTERLILAVVRRMKSAYMLGQYTRAELVDNLKIAGIEAKSAEEYGTAWDLELSLVRRQLSTEKLLRLLRKGILTVDNVRDRLTRLGWSNADRIVMLEEAEQLINERVAKEREAFQRTQAKQGKAMESLIRENQRITEKAQNRLRQLTPLKTVLRWLAEDEVSERWARERLFAMGFDQPTIDLYIQEVKGKETNGTKPETPASP